MKEQANEEYVKYISEMCERIINDKDYKTLAAILTTYDDLVKEKNGILNKIDYKNKPFWLTKDWLGE